MTTDWETQQYVLARHMGTQDNEDALPLPDNEQGEENDHDAT